MAKFYGAVGISAGTVETKPGIHEEQIIERSYFGDVVRDTRNLQEAGKVNRDISVGNSISIVADAHANENIFAIRYVRWMGALWIVENVEVQSPRLLLRLGGVYNGPTPPPTP